MLSFEGFFPEKRAMAAARVSTCSVAPESTTSLNNFDLVSEPFEHVLSKSSGESKLNATALVSFLNISRLSFVRLGPVVAKSGVFHELGLESSTSPNVADMSMAWNDLDISFTWTLPDLLFLLILRCTAFINFASVISNLEESFCAASMSSAV